MTAPHGGSSQKRAFGFRIDRSVGPFLKFEPSFRCLLDPPYYFGDSLQSYLNSWNLGSKLSAAIGDELHALRNGMCHGEYGERKSVLQTMKFQ